ncbi:MAG: carboxypeptidase regulatory-like domain-containing protein [Planctomycetota bacterium]
MRWIAGIVWIWLVAAACGGSNPGGEAKKSDTAAPPAPSSQASRKPWDPAKGTATIKGVVKWSGALPTRRVMDMAADAKCKEAHAEPVLDESTVVNANGTLKNVFVWVKTGLEAFEFAPPTEPVVLDQKGCMYHPHVVGIQVGQPLVIRNSDSLLHNIHGYPTKNKTFNVGQATQGLEHKLTFTAPEVMIRVKCDVHGWMSSHIGVVPHPFFAISGEDGSFTIAHLPAGSYGVEAMHELLKDKSQAVELKDGETKEIEFTFSKG